jgi:hypothetical protein
VNDTNPGYCLTSISNNYTNSSWETCDSCLWQEEKLAIGQKKRVLHKDMCLNAVGVQRFACNPLSAAGLYEILDLNTMSNNAFCNENIGTTSIYINGSKFGLGAKIRCDKNKVVVEEYGYGYFSGDELETYTEYVTETQKILIQPFSFSGFNVANHGMQIINISEYTNMFGKAYEAKVFAAPVQTKPAFVAINIILLVINFLLLTTHVGLTIYEQELKEKYALSAIE